jgi:hypothetical protein
VQDGGEAGPHSSLRLTLFDVILRHISLVGRQAVRANIYQWLMRTKKSTN